MLQRRLGQNAGDEIKTVFRIGCATPINTNNLALGMTSSEVEVAIQKNPLFTWAQDGKIRKVYGSTLYGYMHVDFIDDKAI